MLLLFVSTTIVLSSATVFIQCCYCSINNYNPIFCYCLYSMLLLFHQPLSYLLPLSLFNAAIVPLTAIVSNSINPPTLLPILYISYLSLTPLPLLSLSLYTTTTTTTTSTTKPLFSLSHPLKIIKMSMPQIFFDFCDHEEQLDILGEDIFNVANNKFNLNWPPTKRGYRKALWAVIGDENTLELVPTRNEGKFKSYSLTNLLFTYYTTSGSYYQ